MSQAEPVDESKCWVERLDGDHPDQQNAICELQTMLQVRIARAFRGQAKVDDAFVDDAVQDSLTAILASLDQFNGTSRFTTWATTIAVRTAIREMRRLRWKDASLNHLIDGKSHSIEPTTLADDPAAQAESSELIQQMHRIINEELTEKQRNVLLAHLRGMPQAEIGRHMGMNRNAVYKLGFDARLKLKEKLIAAGFSPSDLISMG